MIPARPRLPMLRKWAVLLAMRGQFSSQEFEGHDISKENGVLEIMRLREVPRTEQFPEGIRVQLVVMIPPGAWGPVTEIFEETPDNQTSIIHRATF